jgi:hypothetical protein
MIGFIDTLYTKLGTTGNYSALADLHTFHFTFSHALGFLLSRIVLGVFSEPLPSNRRLIVAHFGSRGNVFTESLPSNGSVRYNISRHIQLTGIALSH